MRHGQGLHGTTENGHTIRDPHLTPLGEEQCRRRCATFDRHERVDLLLASPLRRALRTAELTFAPAIQRGLKIVAVPMAEEVTDTPSDTGSDVDILRSEFGNAVDFGFLSDGWFVHKGVFATDAQALFARAALLRRWIRDRPEKEVCLVAHGQFNHFLSHEVDENGEQTTPWWDECELRTYEFVDGSENASIRETSESVHRREIEAQEHR